jgi:glycosyltransferase involved in cell wall biosynthesis
MKKVLRIINRFNLGGPTYNAAYLTKYLSSEYETLLVGGQHDETEASSSHILQDLNLNPVIIPEMRREINFKNDRIAYQKIKNIIHEFKPDIVHTHASKAGAIGRIAADKAGVKQIYHTFHGHVFHSYFGKTKTTFYKNLERYLAKKSTNIIAISEIQKHELVQIHKICRPEKVKVIPLGFDLDRFKENQENKRVSFRKEWDIKENEIAIGIIGRIVPIKDHHFFIDVIEKIIKKTDKSLRFFIIGDGESKQQIIDYANSKNITTSTNSNSATVQFTSWIKAIDIANAGLDIICLSSKNEGTPVSLIEAQASYKPIVSTKIGGINDVVINNKTALLSDVGDLDTYVTNLSKLIYDENLRKLFSKNAKNQTNKFTYKRLINDVEKLYF